MGGEAGRPDQCRLSHRQVLSLIPPVELFGIRGGRIQHEKLDTHGLVLLGRVDRHGLVLGHGLPPLAPMGPSRCVSAECLPWSPVGDRGLADWSHRAGGRYIVAGRPAAREPGRGRRSLGRATAVTSRPGGGAAVDGVHGRMAAVSLEESALLDALRRGDEDAFGRLVGEHHASLRRVARLYVANAAIADEVVQDTWLGVIRGIWAFEGRSSLKTWIFRILVNRARTRAVRESRSTPFAGTFSTESGDEPEPSVSSEHSLSGDDSPAPGQWARRLLDPGSSPERVLLTKELGERLRTVIDALPSNLKS